MFTESLKGVSRKFKVIFREASRVFQGSFREILRVFQELFKGFLTKIEVCSNSLFSNLTDIFYL